MASSLLANGPPPWSGGNGVCPESLRPGVAIATRSNEGVRRIAILVATWLDALREVLGLVSAPALRVREQGWNRNQIKRRSQENVHCCCYLAGRLEISAGNDQSSSETRFRCWGVKQPWKQRNNGVVRPRTAYLKITCCSVLLLFALEYRDLSYSRVF